MVEENKLHVSGVIYISFSVKLKTMLKINSYQI